MDNFFNENNENNENIESNQSSEIIGTLESNESNRSSESSEMNGYAYREIIERKPEKSPGRFIALVLAAGLGIGTIFGFGLDNFLPNSANSANSVYAAGRKRRGP
jgi:hypothetical protein